MLLWAALNPFYQVLLSFVITYAAGVGQRWIVVGFNDDYFRNLITAGLVFLIAHIMQEGLKLHEEQTLTV